MTENNTQQLLNTEAGTHVALLDLEAGTLEIVDQGMTIVVKADTNGEGGAVLLPRYGYRLAHGHTWHLQGPRLKLATAQVVRESATVERMHQLREALTDDAPAPKPAQRVHMSPSEAIRLLVDFATLERATPGERSEAQMWDGAHSLLRGRGFLGGE